ncbi:C-type lectin domain family 6 member A-like isoform X2 [Alligator sinensis]|nr:C-type lectin domain family 6 member A-like isoform X2 [Alligator sinensis]
MRGGCPQLNLWTILIPALAFKACVTCGCLVLLFRQSCKEHKTLPQNSAQWHCVLGTPESKERVWRCCPMGWKLFHTSCYYLFSDSRYWDESEKSCMQMGSHLVVINMEAKQDFLLSWLEGTVTAGEGKKSHCLGLYYWAGEGQWHWVDQTPYNQSATFWIPREPNFLPWEKCAVLQVGRRTASSGKRTWNNIRCHKYCHGICETAAVNI